MKAEMVPTISERPVALIGHSRRFMNIAGADNTDKPARAGDPHGCSGKTADEFSSGTSSNQWRRRQAGASVFLPPVGRSEDLTTE
jgi:hypothetical protein